MGNTLLFKQYVQVLLVIAAFTLMVIFSYFFVRDLELEKLRENVRNAISYTELSIRASLLEPETLLASISETVRLMIMDGYGKENVLEYLQDINAYGQSDPNKRVVGILGFYGVFDIFGDEYIYISNDTQISPPDIEPKNRLWYTGAVEERGNLYFSAPNINGQTGIVYVTMSRVLYDEDGNLLGVVCIGLQLTRIREMAVNTKFAEDGFGFLMDADRSMIAHPELSMLGTRGPATTDVNLMQDGYISEREVTNYRGVKSILYIQRLYNGWYMGVITPVNQYYGGVRRIAYILAALGALFAAVLSVILVNLSSAKNKADIKNRAMAHWYKSILNAVGNPITVTNKNMEWTFVNKAVEDFLKVKNDDITGKKCSEWNAKICNTPDCGIERLRAGFKETYFEQFGGKYHVAVSYLYNEKGEIDGHVEVVKDLTDIIEMTKRQADAEAANRAKSDFLARVSHEIRTPMNAILGITEIQLENQNLPHDTQEALGKVYNSGYLLLNIINDILDLSKIEADKLELTPVNYDTASLINDTVHLNVMRYDSKQIDFQVEVDPNIPSTLFGDDLRLKQILNNLLSNAFKYTSGGEISLSVTFEENKAKDNILLIFRVTDTGQGMTEEQVEKLFDEYTRFNMDANRTTEGTGLGMTITRHLVRMMKGEIFVESEPGKGSIFTVHIPQVKVDGGVLGKELTDKLEKFHFGTATRIKKAPQIIRNYMPYGKVLIVDDVETNLYVAKGLMSPYGLTIETASSGYEAVNRIKKGETFDIIFMDHFMPGMDGIEAVKIIRGLNYQKPVIALTANALTGQAEIFLKNGFNEFISKPIDIRQLNSLLNKLVRDKYPKEAAEAEIKQKEMNEKRETIDRQPVTVDSKLKEIFTRDAEKAISALETIIETVIIDSSYRKDDDLHMYIITMHSMKSALANIGEFSLSDLAMKLEQAGREGNITVIAEHTNDFLSSLRKVIDKLKPAETEDITNMNEEDRIFLYGNLAIIKTACVQLDRKTAKEALAKLRERSWPAVIKEQLKTISENLLHSEFDNIKKIADGIIN